MLYGAETLLILPINPCIAVQTLIVVLKVTYEYGTTIPGPKCFLVNNSLNVTEMDLEPRKGPYDDRRKEEKMLIYSTRTRLSGRIARIGIAAFTTALLVVVLVRIRAIIRGTTCFARSR